MFRFTRAALTRPYRLAARRTVMPNNTCIYERNCEPEISIAKEIVGTVLFTIGMVGLILFVHANFVLG
jgi:hypothetical protein